MAPSRYLTHRAASAVILEVANPEGTEAQALAVNATHRARETELNELAAEMKIWLAGNDPTGLYLEVNNAAAMGLQKFQTSRDEYTVIRAEAIRERHAIRGQSSTVPETIPAYVEATALQKRAENDTAANDALADSFIKDFERTKLGIPKTGSVRSIHGRRIRTPPDTIFAGAAIANGSNIWKSTRSLSTQAETTARR